jgi:molybdenum cofactor biosynthesis enzyme MoaA
MPGEGLDWLERSELMTHSEMLRICSVLVGMGIQKIRITGGEPFVRKDIMPFLKALSLQRGLGELTITTNGILTAPFVPDLKKIGIRAVNLSLDSLDRKRFFDITRRDELPRVLETLERLLIEGISVKINAVVMDGKNTEDILPLVEMTRDLDVSMRFIEEMPFNGQGSHYEKLDWDHVRILETIRSKYPGMQKMQDPPYSTSSNYRVPGYRGDIGIIAAYSRTFCGTCNRLRITPTGVLKTCLYDEGVLNIRDLLRQGLSDENIVKLLLQTFTQRPRDGWEAEKKRNGSKTLHESMARIGG